MILWYCDIFNPWTPCFWKKYIIHWVLEALYIFLCLCLCIFVFVLTLYDNFSIAIHGHGQTSLHFTATCTRKECSLTSNTTFNVLNNLRNISLKKWFLFFFLMKVCVMAQLTVPAAALPTFILVFMIWMEWNCSFYDF